MFRAIVTFFSVLMVGCGYTFQGAKSPLLEQEKIRRVYVKPLVNNTYKAGVENLVYNALIKALRAGDRVILVRSPEESDAILSGSVNSAFSSVTASTTMDKLQPQGVWGSGDVSVATVYTANLNCGFALDRRITIEGKRPRIWASDFGRAKSFPAATQLDIPGTTSSLINESEFDRALSDLATSMMADLHESMLAMF